MQRTATPIDHLVRVSQGEFPEDTRDFLTAMINQGMRDSRHVDTYIRLTGRLGRYQRDAILRDLWAGIDERRDLTRASRLISDYRRFNGRTLPGQPVTRLHERLRALETAGVRIPGERQLVRICAG